MSSLVKRLAYEAAEPFGRVGAEIVRKGVPLLASMICLVVSAVFLTIALANFLYRMTGAETEAAIIGGVYLFAAILASVIARRGRKMPETGAEAPSPPARKLSGQKLSGQPPTQPRSAPDFSEQIDRVIAPALNTLGDAGLARERAILEAVSAAAKELKPAAGVVFAIITGVLIGRRLTKRP